MIGGRVDRFDYLNDFVFSPRDDVPDQAAGEPDVPDVLQPRLSFAVGHQQPPRCDHREPINLGALSPLLAGRIYPLPVSIGRQPRPDEVQSLDAYEIGYSGVVATARDSAAAFYVNKSKNDILFTRGRRARWTGGESAARTGRCRRS